MQLIKKVTEIIRQHTQNIKNHRTPKRKINGKIVAYRGI
jgi:hypothetical protein